MVSAGNELQAWGLAGFTGKQNFKPLAGQREQRFARKERHELLWELFA